MYSMCPAAVISIQISETVFFFVTGPETMSKSRFIITSLLQNIVFGFIPFVIFICNPRLHLLGSTAVLSIGMGVGDYYNAINAIRQMPKGARCYAYKTETHWYMP